MTTIRDERHAQLRLGPGVSGPEARGSAGVLVFLDIPPGANVFAQVDRPVEMQFDGVFGESSDGGAAAGATQPYRFERAQMPATFITESGVTFSRPFTMQRVLLADGESALLVNQEVPAYANFAVPQNGALVQKGHKEHLLPMPGGNLTFANRHVLRVRWTGTAVAAEVQASPPLSPNTPNGTTRKFTGQLGGTAGVLNIAPGSVVMTATVNGSALTIRDDGSGRLVGLLRDGSSNVIASADGFIEYLNGKYELVFGPRDASQVPDAATNITADYEKDCRYKPLDVWLAWDSLAQ